MEALFCLVEVSGVFLRLTVGGRLEVVSEAEGARISVLRFAAGRQLCHLEAGGVFGDWWEFRFIYFFHDCLG